MSDNRTTINTVLVGCASGLIAIPVLLLLILILVSVVSAFTGRGSSTNVELVATLLVSCFLIPIIVGAIYFATVQRASGRSIRTVGCTWLIAILIGAVLISIISLVMGPDLTVEAARKISDSSTVSDATRKPSEISESETPVSSETDISTDIIATVAPSPSLPLPTNTPVSSETGISTDTIPNVAPSPSLPRPTNTPAPTKTASATRLPQCEDNQNADDISGFSILEILDINYIDGAVRIIGCTDLPDKALLDVSFDITNYQPDDSYVGVSTQTQVLDGFYEASLVPPNIPQYQQGPYEVEVWFRPHETQPSNVLDMVGSNGEQLFGERVRQLATADKTLIITSTVDLSLDIVLPTYPQIDSSVYEIDSPERALAEFLLAWQREDWERMASLTQLTWRDSVDDPALELEYMFGFKTLLGAEISPDESPISDYYSVPSIIVDYALNPTWTKKVLIQPSVIREDEPYSPSDSGSWGVNPISMLGETELELDDSTTDNATATPSNSLTTMLDANITGIDTATYGNIARYTIHVTLAFPVSEDAIVGLCEEVVENFKREQSFNAVAVYFSDLDAHYFGFTIARCDYAPHGVWADADNVSTGDYSQHEYSHQFQPKVSEPRLAVVEMPSNQERELCNEWMVTAESLEEKGYDPITESEAEANRLIAEKYGMEIAKVEETVLKCVLWAAR